MNKKTSLANMNCNVLSHMFIKTLPVKQLDLKLRYVHPLIVIVNCTKISLKNDLEKKHSQDNDLWNLIEIKL